MATENKLFNSIFILLLLLNISTFGQKAMGKIFTLKAGDEFGYFTLTGNSKFKGGIRYVECTCICGNVGYRVASFVKSGISKSCGCKRSEAYQKTNIATGNSVTGNDVNHPLYAAWSSLKGRCHNPKCSGYKNYGGRGIKVCKKWLRFKPFLEWAILNGWKEGDGLTVDRFPNQNGNYTPKNCRIATWPQQQRNKRNNRIMSAFGEEKCVSDWAEDKRCVVTRQKLFNRLRYRYNTLNFEDALTII